MQVISVAITTELLRFLPKAKKLDILVKVGSHILRKI